MYHPGLTALPKALAERPKAGAAGGKYLADQVAAATPAQLTAMVFDKAVLSMRQAQAALEEGRLDDAGPHVLNAQDCVAYLRATLNHDVDDPAAADLAVRLDALYFWVEKHLIAANLRRDAAALEEALKCIAPLAQAWRATIGAPGTA